MKKRNYNRIKAQLAPILGVTQQTVSKWATNHSQPSIPELFQIAYFLNIPVSDLLVR